tara:strand:+ start:1393 stop:1665 length:273 start_codon:yes stop_codon:yes gene_type:complete
MNGIDLLAIGLLFVGIALLGCTLWLVIVLIRVIQELSTTMNILTGAVYSARNELLEAVQNSVAAITHTVRDVAGSPLLAMFGKGRSDDAE